MKDGIGCVTSENGRIGAGEEDELWMFSVKSSSCCRNGAQWRTLSSFDLSTWR
jgi:hypothetical protein